MKKEVIREESGILDRELNDALEAYDWISKYM